MHKRKVQSIDGFVLRRRPSNSLGATELDVSRMALPNRFLKDDSGFGATVPLRQPDEALPKPQVNAAPMINRSEIDASLASIDEPTEKKTKRRRYLPGWLSKKRIALIIIALILIFVGYFAVKFIITSGRVFGGNLFDLLGKGTVLKADQYGRSNILVFGTSEDDPSHVDAGANLTDSLMVVSVDQKGKNVAMFSIPRDIWVKYGTACTAGYEGKINAIYSCFSNDGVDEQKGAQALMKNVSQNFGIDIQYYTHINYTVVKDAVDAVGGVDITIKSSDPRGILDRNFDWACKYQCYYVKYPNGPAHLDGIHALYLARARNDSGGYGLPQGNFDRENNQQKIITALKEKATTAGTLANPIAINGLLDSLGTNVRTNFQAGEIKTLITLAKDIPTASIRQISLVDTKEPVVTTGTLNGQSIVRPIDGVYDFGGIRTYLRSKLRNDPISHENAHVEVLNGSDSMGVASTKASQLKQDGFANVTTADTDTNAAYSPFVWYDLSGGKMPNSLAKLKSVLGKAPTGTTLPSSVQSDADFVIIVGNGSN